MTARPVEGQPDEQGGAVSDAPVYKLNFAAVGYSLIEAVAKSAMFGHSKPAETMNPYAMHDEVMSPEYQFVRDVLTMSTQELASKWWGGEFEATLHAQNTIQEALYPSEPEVAPADKSLEDLVVDAMKGQSSVIAHEGKPVVRITPYEADPA